MVALAHVERLREIRRNLHVVTEATRNAITVRPAGRWEACWYVLRLIWKRAGRRFWALADRARYRLAVWRWFWRMPGPADYIGSWSFWRLSKGDRKMIYDREYQKWWSEKPQETR